MERLLGEEREIWFLGSAVFSVDGADDVCADLSYAATSVHDVVVANAGRDTFLVATFQFVTRCTFCHGPHIVCYHSYRCQKSFVKFLALFLKVRVLSTSKFYADLIKNCRKYWEV